MSEKCVTPDVCSLTMAEFIEREGLSMSAQRRDSRPDGVIWSTEAYHFLCKIKRGPVTMRVWWSQGSGCGSAAPDLADVLDSLALESCSAGEKFEDWCREYGEDTDSRRAEKVWRACRKQRANLLKLLGESEDHCPVLDDLLYNVERL